MGVTVVVADVAAPHASAALQAYFGELARRFPEGFDGARALDEVGALLSPPAGVFVLAIEDEVVLGCGGIHFLDASTAELRRMWVDPTARGRGIGRAVLAFLEGRATDAGCTAMVLDTHSALIEAIGLYRSAGYEPIERYNDNPSAHHWFRKVLDPGRPVGSVSPDG